MRKTKFKGIGCNASPGTALRDKNKKKRSEKHVPVGLPRKNIIHLSLWGNPYSKTKT